MPHVLRLPLTLSLVLLVIPIRASAAQPVVQRVAQVSDDGSVLSPGTNVNVLGTELGPQVSTQCMSFNPPNEVSCGGVSVTVGEKPAFVFWASDSQLQMQIPTELNPGVYPLVVERTVNGQKVKSNSLNVTLAAVSPALSTLNGTGTGPVLAYGIGGQLLTEETTAGPGDRVSLIATGLGRTTPPIATGQLTPPGVATDSPVTASINGISAEVVWAGRAQGGTTGFYDVGLKVPAGLANGKYPISIAIQGKQSQSGTTISISSAPAIAGVSNAASYVPGVSPGAWSSVFGARFAAVERAWTSSDIVGGVLPTRLENVSVKVNGKSAAISYVGPAQVNFLAPDDTRYGWVKVEITAPTGTASFDTGLSQYVPGFFSLSGNYLIALFPDWSYVAKPGLLPATVSSRPAKPGDHIVFYGTGFGAANPAVPTDRVFSGAAPLAGTSALSVTVGGVAAKIEYAGMVGNGLVQINIQVPDVADGDQEVIATIGGVSSVMGRYITIKR